MRPRRARRIARLYGGAALCGFLTPINIKKRCLTSVQITTINAQKKTRKCLTRAFLFKKDREMASLSNMVYFLGKIRLHLFGIPHNPPFHAVARIGRMAV